MEKIRLDQLLVNKGYYESREKAKAAVMAGLVFVGSERTDKPGARFSPDVTVTIKGPLHPYVSRGGLKLAKALYTFGLSLKDRVVLDIGASTGGFTDCALQHGARLVYAVDVGYGQLAWKLRQDQRVVVMERTNFRYLKKEHLTKGLPEVAVIDLSFISLKLILPVLEPLLQPGGLVIALVKPQFEAGKGQVGKKGVIKDRDVHQMVLEDMVAFMRAQRFAVKDLTYSPVTGGEGNIEFLVFLQKGPFQSIVLFNHETASHRANSEETDRDKTEYETDGDEKVNARYIQKVVLQAHEVLLEK